MIVLLPHPVGPTKAVFFPISKCNEIFLRTSTSDLEG